MTKYEIMQRSFKTKNIKAYTLFCKYRPVDLTISYYMYFLLFLQCDFYKYLINMLQRKSVVESILNKTTLENIQNIAFC